MRESDDNLGPLLDRKGLSQKSGKPAMMDDDEEDDDGDDKEEQVEEEDDDEDDDDDDEDMATFMRESNKDLKKLKKQKKTESKSLGKNHGKVAYNDFDEAYEDDEENHFGGDFGEGDLILILILTLSPSPDATFNEIIISNPLYSILPYPPFDMMM